MSATRRYPHDSSDAAAPQRAASAGLGVGLVVTLGADVLISAFGMRTAMLVVAGANAYLGTVGTVLFADKPEVVGADIGVEFEVPCEMIARYSSDINIDGWR
ncbi:hypothetical protein [Natrinema halophilum]|uniref:Uncharacterized protein n=1 Tax=Natrinema halophilum TaxID=1699371 RepID=A0A7D5H1Z6_9EURY|nr:hypothetical protein [Natrinema halophilum]QLG48691.1 hypothetical protein HYG82_07440 [Natrinema halophilum]